ncbi:AraC family transcriptional regulator [uncultured Vibrio sp.]|uniref:AraC family transcriptional regulator n=1 Tax=uncultured Vibrio sp. TaxID=114054 RepID=UPI0025E58EC9|nr:AraC family transcriptional regulator [uncultured Vibrio sp.]
MSNHNINDKRAKLRKPKFKKIALTQKIEATEKQIIVSKGEKEEAPLAEGHFVSYCFNDGFSIHGGCFNELANSNVISTAPKSLIVTLLIEGQLKFGYDDLTFDLDTSRPNSASQPVAVLVNLNKPASFHRNISQGNRVTKMNLMLQPKWIKERLGLNCSISTFLESHKNYLAIEIDEKMTALAKQIITSQPPKTFIDKLQFETLSYSLFVQLLNELAPQLKLESSKPILDQQTPPPVDHRIEDVISYIESELGHPLSLESIALRFSMSISNLQRKFKQQFGLTVNSYIRYRRLEVAKQHLEQGLVSVTEAAYEAGYHHPANFTNAFKKTFGRPPTTYAKI